MTLVRNFIDAYSRHRFACLFFSLLVTLVSAPMLGEMGFGGGMIEVFLGLNILGAVFITLLRFKSYVGFGLLVLLIAARTGKVLLGLEGLLLTSQGVGAGICLLSVFVMLSYSLREGSVTSERIFAALDAYLMFGLMCGLLYCTFEEEWPGSFLYHGSPMERGGRMLYANAIYFSYVTLGTLGYGDIVPIGGPARALAVVEAIGGQMYLVVVVARLVSLYKSQSDRNDVLERAAHLDPDKFHQS